MNRFGELIRSVRTEKDLSLEKVSTDLGIDVAILSKLERGIRSATRQQAELLSEYFRLDKNQALTIWLSDKVYEQVEEDSNGLDALKLAEEALVYQKTTLASLQQLKEVLIPVFSSDDRIMRAWVFGSFSRSDATEHSDLDLLLELDDDSGFNFFDLAEIQYRAEEVCGLEIDIGVLGSEKEEIKDSIDRDRILIYEKAD